MPYQHPVNIANYDEAPLGARIADRVTGFMGSWKFIVIQTVVMAIWIGGNIYLLSKPFDPFPFILLNLAFSTQAAYAAPLIPLAGNRQSWKDRETLEHAVTEADKADAQNVAILKALADTQKEILRIEQSILEEVRRVGPATPSAS